ncbi:short-chain dehydrogenase/reductase-like protein [Podospora didyma]|uniref:Short-chain dehydrogenase/reductase-like protein n=1 Tax=Podospora didyma TaxID=330526 RepID=A0AAE0KJX5_9PEZI|nr:short-chain dehydrogenase/reductase-like protein [Podospora didyma]
MASISPKFFLNFLVYQFSSLPVPKKDYNGHTVIVTGANVGLGFEAARHFVRLGAARVILACRSTEKGEAAKQDIEKTTPPAPGAVIEVWPLDLCSFESVKEFCRRAAKLDRLDVLLENAGVAMGTFTEAEGYETTITVNVISTFLIAVWLLPTLRRTAAQFNVTPHLTIVASEAHNFARFPERHAPQILEEFRPGKGSMFDRYNTSKLLDVFMARELAERASSSSSVVINSTNPGLCWSELSRNTPYFIRPLLKGGLYLLARSTEVGSRCLMAAADAGPESHGKYIDSCQVSPPNWFVLSDDGVRAQRRVYAELLEIVEGIEPGITKNI